MAHWIDNADSYLCSECGFECNNPNNLPYGDKICPECKAKMTTKEQSTMSGWISVKDRLPEGDGTYLVCSNGFVMTAIYTSCIPGAKVWIKNCELLMVTHWMPLPEPPDETKKQRG